MIGIVGGVGTFDTIGKSGGESGNGFVWFLFHGTEFSTGKGDGYGVDVNLFHCFDESFIAFRIGRVIASF